MSTAHSASARVWTLITLLLASYSSCIASFAGVVFVNGNATGSVHNGQSWTSALTSIKAGVDAASSGDNVWVAKGVYPESVTIAKAVNLVGGFTGTETDVSQRDWRNNPVVLDGGGASCIITATAASITIDGLTIRNSDRLTGVGVAFGGVSSAALNCTFLHHGTAVIAAKAATVENCIVADADTGVDCSQSASSVEGNVITGCGTAIHSGASAAAICNNTIVNNSIGVDSARSLRGNIIAWNETGVARFIVGTSPDPANNCLYRNDSDWGSQLNQTGLNGNISADPKLASAAAGDFRLLPGSPCIDAGYATTLPLAVDIYGQSRVLGAKIDIGAAECGDATPTHAPVIIRVSPKGDDSNDGFSWAAPKRTLQAAVDSAFGYGGEVWVRRGKYTDPVVGYFTVNLYGGFDGDEASREERRGAAFNLCVDPRRTAVTVAARVSPVTVDEVSIRGGYSGFRCDGGATTISNCAVSGCTDGIAVYVDSPAIVNDTLVENTHGLFCSDGTPVLTNTILAANAIGVLKDPNGVGAPLLTYCCINGNVTDFSGIADPRGANGNINGDPLLASIEFGDVHIQPGSPCISAGNIAVAPIPGNRDMDGEPRVSTGGIDIGADQCAGTIRTVIPKCVWVDGATGSDANDGSTHALAKKTVQAGIADLTPEGGEVWVAQGVYAENVTVAPFVYLYGGFTGEEIDRAGRNSVTHVTVLSGDSSLPNVTFMGGNVTNGIDGFTIRNSYLGIKCDSASPIIAHNTFVDAQEALAASDSSPLVLRNSVIGGSCGLAFSGGAPSIHNNILRDNYSTGIACWNAASSIRNNVVLGSGQNGIDIVGGTATLTGNTVVGGDIGMSVSDNAAVSLTNSVVAYNLTGLQVGAAPTEITVGHCDLFSNNVQTAGITDPSGTNGNVSVDPGFASVTYGDVHLQPSSPLIGSGDVSTVLPGDVDMDGESRTTAGAVDIGADQADHQIRTISPTIVRVDQTIGSDTNDGSTWLNAKKTIQAGIAAAAAVGGEVWVAGGAYSESIRLLPFAYVYGGFTQSESSRLGHVPVAGATVLGGTSMLTVAKIRGGNAFTSLDGVTISNAILGISSIGSMASITRSMFTGNKFALSDLAGRMRIAGNTFSANGNAGYYAVILSGGSTSMFGNRFASNGSNSVPLSGGVRIDGGSQIIDGNLFTNNRNAIYSAGSGSIVNNTISGGNTGIYVNGPTGTPVSADVVANNVIYLTNAYGVYVSGSAITVSAISNDVFRCPTLYTGVSDPTGSSGNISTDPLFRDATNGDFRLSTGSPCIDAGSDDSIITGLTDLYGVARPQGLHIDIGAIEYVAPSRTLADVLNALRIAGGFAMISTGDLANLDANADGTISLDDAVWTFRKAEGLDPS